VPNTTSRNNLQRAARRILASKEPMCTRKQLQTASGCSKRFVGDAFTTWGVSGPKMTTRQLELLAMCTQSQASVREMKYADKVDVSLTEGTGFQSTGKQGEMRGYGDISNADHQVAMALQRLPWVESDFPMDYQCRSFYRTANTITVRGADYFIVDIATGTMNVSFVDFMEHPEGYRLERFHADFTPAEIKASRILSSRFSPNLPLQSADDQHIAAAGSKSAMSTHGGTQRWGVIRGSRASAIRIPGIKTRVYPLYRGGDFVMYTEDMA